MKIPGEEFNEIIRRTKAVKPPFLSVVIPCYNEKEVIAETIQQLKAFCLNAYNQMLKLILLMMAATTVLASSLFKTMPKRSSKIQLIGFARHFGHQIAVNSRH